MADFATFGDLKNRVREGLADNTDTFFTATEIGVAVNEGVWELYKMLHAANIGFFFNLTPEVITITPSANYYTLTNNFAWVDQIMPVDPNNNALSFYYKDRHDEFFRDLLQAGADQFWTSSGTYFFDVVSDKTIVVVPRPSMTFNVNVYLVQDPIEMSADGDIPPLKTIFRPVVVEYAVRKLKNKEETGEYMSNEKLLAFLLESTSKYVKPRSGTNQLTVEAY